MPEVRSRKREDKNSRRTAEVYFNFTDFDPLELEPGCRGPVFRKSLRDRER